MTIQGSGLLPPDPDPPEEADHLTAQPTWPPFDAENFRQLSWRVTELERRLSNLERHQRPSPMCCVTGCACGVEQSLLRSIRDFFLCEPDSPYWECEICDWRTTDANTASAHAETLNHPLAWSES